MQKTEINGKKVGGASAACIALLLILVSSFGRSWTAPERTLIRNADSLMRVTTLPGDSAVLRTPSRDIGMKELRSKELRSLLDKMLYTVKDPSQDGVGIAAPQVGINRRIVWVQRMDKPGEPFEPYVNIHLDSLLGKVTVGPEGCLSVPPMRGLVPRYEGVIVSYTDLATGKRCQEKVEGYTAIIFQHECDHLDGTLYIDRADSVFVDRAWEQERKKYNYDGR